MKMTMENFSTGTTILLGDFPIAQDMDAEEATAVCVLCQRGHSIRDSFLQAHAIATAPRPEGVSLLEIFKAHFDCEASHV